jgi:hypothetical protein
VEERRIVRELGPNRGKRRGDGWKSKKEGKNGVIWQLKEPRKKE